MLIRNTPDVYQKLQHLGGMATDDVLSPETGSGHAVPRPDWHGVAGQGVNTPYAGVYRAAMPNGKRISLMRVMFTDYCMMDCHYCPNSYWVPRQRYGFKVDELARLFDEMHRRHMVDGLFLSSGIFKDPDHTQERLLNVVEAVRGRYGFKGYIHLKVMPGTSDPALFEAAQRLGTRLSINMEQPTEEHLSKVSAMKRFGTGILEPMQRIARDVRERYGGAVGQATQLVVGAADESDLDIFGRMRYLYGELDFKRVYYSPFRPIKYTPLEEHPATPMARTNRLYQLDWLSRFYGFEEDDLRLAFDDAGYLDLRADPKLMITAHQIDRFPLDVNHAPEQELLRVPGIGPRSSRRIVQQRARHTITRWQELQAMGVVVKRALPFLWFPGHRPEPASQGRLPLDDTSARGEPSRPQAAAEIHAQHAASGCAGCLLSPTSCGMPAPAGQQLPAPAAA